MSPHALVALAALVLEHGPGPRLSCLHGLHGRVYFAAAPETQRTQKENVPVHRTHHVLLSGVREIARRCDRRCDRCDSLGEEESVAVNAEDAVQQLAGRSELLLVLQLVVLVVPWVEIQEEHLQQYHSLDPPVEAVVGRSWVPGYAGVRATAVLRTEYCSISRGRRVVGAEC